MKVTKTKLRRSARDKLLTIDNHRSDAVSEMDQPKQFILTVTSIFMIPYPHVSDRQECDGEVIGCLNMLTRTYTTGRRQPYSREDHEQLHYKAKKIEQHTFSTKHKTQCSEVRKGRIWMIKVLKITKLMCQMRLQSHTQTHFNQTTKNLIPYFSACGSMPPSVY